MAENNKIKKIRYIALKGAAILVDILAALSLLAIPVGIYIMKSWQALGQGRNNSNPEPVFWEICFIWGLMVGIPFFLTGGFSALWREANNLKRQYEEKLLMDQTQNKEVEIRQLRNKINDLLRQKKLSKNDLTELKSGVHDYADELFLKYEKHLRAKTENYTLPYVTDENFYKKITEYMGKEIGKRFESCTHKMHLNRLIKKEMLMQKFLVTQKQREL